MDDTATHVLKSLAYQAPELLVCLATLVLAVMYRDCARVPRLLAIAGACVLIATNLGTAVTDALLVPRALGHEYDIDAILFTLSIIVIARTCAYAMGLGLLVTGIFIGRRPAVGRSAEPLSWPTDLNKNENPGSG